MGLDPNIDEILIPKFLIGRADGMILELDEPPCDISVKDLCDREILRQQHLSKF